MSDTFQPGDLVTGRSGPDKPSYLANLIARPAGDEYWILRISPHSIMTVAEVAKVVETSYHDKQKIVTVLHDGRLIEVFLHDLQRLDGTDR